MRHYENLPVSAPAGKWATDLCACWTSPWCLMPCCSLLTPCVPLARAAGRAGVLPFSLVLLVGGACFTAISLWPEPTNTAVVVVTPSQPSIDVEGEVDVFLESSVGRWYWLSNVLFFLVVSAFFALHLIVRRRIVLKYAIEEHPALSCVLVLACPCCAVAQSAIHVDLVEHGAVQQDCSCAPKHPLADRTTNGDVLGDVEML
mmetsp:Transcript_35615/g.83686  ORF Transcript_35615/g.83686 Transcript_35615/m.83686 type:complete len:202 (-) Transcript_35615:109-714(-)